MAAFNYDGSIKDLNMMEAKSEDTKKNSLETSSHHQGLRDGSRGTRNHHKFLSSSFRGVEISQMNVGPPPN